MKSVADVLANAREYIERHGWLRGDITNREGNVCAYGALVYSQGWYGTGKSMSPRQMDTIVSCQNLLIEQAQKVHPDQGIDTVPDWNDRVAQNEQEVLDVFAKAEKAARAGFDPDEGVEI